MTREPTWSMTGFSFCVDLNIRTRASGWIKLDSGIAVALNAAGAGENWARLSGVAARVSAKRAIRVHGVTILRINNSWKNRRIAEARIAGRCARMQIRLGMWRSPFSRLWSKTVELNELSRAKPLSLAENRDEAILQRIEKPIDTHTDGSPQVVSK